MDNLSLGEALTSTETIAQTAPDPAQVESTVSAQATDQSATLDSSLTSPVPGEQQEPAAEGEQGEKPVETRAEMDFKALREQKTTLETELQTVRSRLDEFGGESQLSLMQPFLQKAMEVPRTETELDAWSGSAWTTLSGTLLPVQVDAMKSQAAWGYLNDPASQRVITESIYGEGVTPEAIAEFAKAYRENPDILSWFRPEETAEEKTRRETFEARERERDTRDKERDAQFQRLEEDRLQAQTREVMGSVFQAGLTPRAEVKKQYELEKSEKDTPEISSFKDRASRRYDQITTLMLSSDAQLNNLANAAEALAGQKDERQRARAGSQYAPLIEARTRAICAQVAKELAEDLKLLSPELSDRAKAENLKDLPAQVLGGTASVDTSSGFDLSGMPDPARDPRGYEAFVARVTAEQARAQRTPGILQG